MLRMIRKEFSISRLACALILMIGGSALAETYQWCGPTSGGCMQTGNNWSNVVTGVKTTIGNAQGDYGNVIVFDCAALGTNEVQVQFPYDGWKLGSLRILNGTVKMTSLYGGSRFLNFGNLTNEIYVAEGATLELGKGPSFCGPYDGEADFATLVKTGDGILRVAGANARIGYSSGDKTRYPLLRCFYVKEGQFECVSGEGGSTSDGICPHELRIGSGRDVSILVNNVIENSTIVHVEEGAKLTLATDTVGALVGAGSATFTSISLTLPAKWGPFEASGMLKGSLEISSSVTQTDVNSCYVLASADVFAGVIFTPISLAGESFLKFAPGIGTFYLGGYTPTTGQPLTLQDTAGDPVTVFANGTASTEPFTAGPGSFYQANNAGGTYLKGVLAHTGTLGVTNLSGNVTLGDGTAANDPDLTQFESFHVVGMNNAVTFKNAAATTISGKVYGAGYVYASGAPLTLADYEPEQGNLYSSADVTLLNPRGLLYRINLSTADSSVTLAGGSLTSGTSGNNYCVLVTGGIPGSTLVISNALLQAATLDVGTVKVVDGGVLDIRSVVDATAGAASSSAQPQSFVFDGGRLQLGAFCGGGFDSQIKTQTTKAPYRTATVGKDGLTISMCYDSYYAGASVGTFLSGVAEGQDGGITVKGRGWLRVDGSWSAVSGPVRILGTLFEPNPDAGDTFELQGDVELGTTRLYYVSARSDSALATRSGACVTLSGVAALDPLHQSDSSYSTFTLGPADAALDASLTRSAAGGVLALVDRNTSSSLFTGNLATPAVKVNGGLSNGANGLTKFPAFAFHYTSGHALVGDRALVAFLAYDATKGFVEQLGSAWDDVAEKSATTPVLVDKSSAAISVAADTAVGGLNVIGRNGDALKIEKGVTLTVGAGTDPALVLLNTSHASGRGKAVIAGDGTLDFGPREGIIVANKRQYGTTPAVIGARLAGTGGITFAGVTEEETSVQLNSANDYTGGTRVMGSKVVANAAGCFGTDAVRVATGLEMAGEVNFAVNGTWANDFQVQGCGCTKYSANTGVLGFWANQVVLTGDILLEDDTYFATDSASNCGTLSGQISGTANLNLKGVGTIVFSAVNTYRGTTTLESGTTLTLRGVGTLGDGPVVMQDATLRFENVADIVLTNAVSGTGTIIAAGTGKVKFANASGFTGTFKTEGSGSVDLNGVSCLQELLIGSGTYVNSGAAATITVSNSALSVFSGTIGGPISFVKQGSAEQKLSGLNTYAGATVVADGTLTLGALTTSATLPVTNALLHLDADEGVTCESDSDRVASWADADGRDFTFANMNYKSLATPNAATLMTDHVNGHSVLHFDHSAIRLQAAGKACSVRTYFNALAWGHDGSATENLDGVFGKGNADSGVRINSSLGPGYGDVQDDAVNGTATSFTKGEFHVFRRIYAANADFANPSVGDYSQYDRPFGGDIGEIVAYDHVLNESEIDAVTDYLMVKWGVREALAYERLTDVLPSDTDLTVAEGATLLLNGMNQTVATLAGAGTISNAIQQASLLTLTEDSEFGGKLASGINLCLAENVTLTLTPGATLNEKMVITAKEGSILDLGGETFTIRTFRGNQNQVRNGTLIQTRPVQGMLIMLR